MNLRASEQVSDEHKRISPLGVVPCLVVDGRPLAESVAILEYVEEVFPEPALLPRETWRRARVRQVVELVNSGVQPLANIAVLDRVSKDEGIRKAWAQHWNRRGLAALESLLSSVESEFGAGRYAFGDTLTLADIFLVPQVANAIRFEVPLDPYPRVRRIYEACMKLDAALASAPENQPDAPRPS